MSCECKKDPCECCRRTKCDLYVPGTPNVWVERADVSKDLFSTATPNYSVPGICSLDTLDKAQVIYIVERDEKARKDLLAVTSDKELRKIADRDRKIAAKAKAEAALIDPARAMK